MGEPAIVGIADDLTGALEAGAKFTEYGLAAKVLTARRSEEPPDRFRALVYDIQTRHVPEEEAHRRIVSMREQLAAWPRAIRYKKTDSTLRGNICAELQALASLHPARSIVYCPAYPAMGRIVREGRLYVDGVPVSNSPFRDDPLNPVASSCLASLFRTGCSLPIQNVSPYELALSSEPFLYICDGESESDVGAAARFVVAHASQVIGAGPASLAGSIAGLMSRSVSRPNWPAIRMCHIVNGSLHPAAIAQIAWAESNAVTALGSGWTVFRNESSAQGLERASALGQKLLRLIGETDMDAILIFGGDTAFGLIAALGHPSLHAMGEPVPGVALARIAGEDMAAALPGRTNDLYLLTKAGGFGSPDLIMQLRRVLTNEVRQK